MPRNDVSSTARAMAGFRALESAKPDAQRLFNDPFAKRFLSSGERVLVECSRFSALRWLIEHHVDHLAPGARTSGIARTRLIDDWVCEEVKDGARQVVILGAGYDCRALRLPELAGVKVFEVDRQAMVALKAPLLSDAASPNVARVGVDFLRDKIEGRLCSAGFDRSLPTVVIWEGVTNYLDRAAIDAVFAFVARNTPQGSKVVFTYVHSDALSGHFEAPGLQRLLQGLRKRGEPWTFGFNPSEIEAYLAPFGLRPVADLGAAEYRRLYWPTLPDEPIGYEFYRVALAERIADAAR